MSVTDIARLIFDENSTLFQVLDQLGVPELYGSLRDLDSRVNQVGVEIRQLGIIVDTNKAQAEERFIEIDTRLNTVDTQIADISAVLEDLELEIPPEISGLVARVVALEGRMSMADSRIDSLESANRIIHSDIAQLQAQYTSLSTTVSQHTSQISALTTTSGQHSSSINTLNTRMAGISNMPGIVTPTINYRMGPRASATWSSSMATYNISGTYGSRLRWGEWYQCSRDGAPYDIKFLDPMGWMNNSSAPINQTVNLGYCRYVIRVRGGSTVTIGDGNISVYNN